MHSNYVPSSLFPLPLLPLTSRFLGFMGTFASSSSASAASSSSSTLSGTAFNRFFGCSCFLLLFDSTLVAAGMTSSSSSSGAVIRRFRRRELLDDDDDNVSAVDSQICTSSPSPGSCCISRVNNSKNLLNCFTLRRSVISLSSEMKIVSSREYASSDKVKEVRQEAKVHSKDSEWSIKWRLLGLIFHYGS